MNKFLLLFFTVAFISPLHFAKDFKGAEYRTKEAFLYGRFEVRYKSPAREGVLASFFTYFDGTDTDPWSSDKWNEIDIEILGRYDNDVQLNTITGGQINHVRHQFTNFNPHLDFHTYAFEWTPGYVAWFIDGEEIHSQTGEHIQTISRAQKLMMNIWNPIFEGWIGEWDPKVLPAFAFYDWVSYYEYTPGTGSYGSANNFTHSWTDDFNEWDQDRWQKATHTFGGNNCDFIPENAVFQNGYLILCLTNSTNLGYTDLQAPFLKWARASSDKILIHFSEEVEKISAENTTNYIIPGLSITSSALLADQKSVELTAQNIDPNISYNFICRDVKDIAGNTMGLIAMMINMPQSLETPIKINCGGIAFDDFKADQQWSSAVEYGYLDGGETRYPASLGIAGTDNDQIFRDERWGAVKYYARVPNGSYTVRILLAENYHTEAGKRIFDIYINGEIKADDVDVFATAGLNTAYEIELTDIQVNSEILEIHLAAEVGQTILNGLVIDKTITKIEEGKLQTPQQFRLHQNFPNPFNGSTVIQYFVQQSDNLFFDVYDLLGEKIYTKSLGFKESGTHSFLWEAKDLKNLRISSGVYFYSIRGLISSEIKKLVLLN